MSAMSTVRLILKIYRYNKRLYKIKFKEEKTMKNTKGITLIALIITIIVMLILVAVSISVALNTGLFKSAGDATKNWKSAQDAEANVGSEIKIGDKTYASIEDYLNNNPMSTIKINMEVTHQDTAVTADGTNIKSIEHGVPIPVGYSYVTGEKNTGVVIQDDDTRDQFVWVPVLQNQKIKIEIADRVDVRFRLDGIKQILSTFK